jgi:hypothetical protein
MTIEEKLEEKANLQPPENDDVPLISPELFLELLNRLGKVGDLISMYDEMLDWYGEINPSDLAQSSVTSTLETESTEFDEGSGIPIQCSNEIELLVKYSFLSRKQNPEQSLVSPANEQQYIESNEPQERVDSFENLRYRGRRV